VGSSIIPSPPLPFPKVRRLRDKRLQRVKEAGTRIHFVLTDGFDSATCACMFSGMTVLLRGGGSIPDDICAILSERFKVRFIAEGNRGYAAAYRASDEAWDAEGFASYARYLAETSGSASRKRLINQMTERYAKGVSDRSVGAFGVLLDPRARKGFIKALNANPMALAHFRSLFTKGCLSTLLGSKPGVRAFRDLRNAGLVTGEALFEVLNVTVEELQSLLRERQGLS